MLGDPNSWLVRSSLQTVLLKTKWNGCLDMLTMAASHLQRVVSRKHRSTSFRKESSKPGCPCVCSSFMAAWEEQLIIESYCRGKCMTSKSLNAACSWFRLLSLPATVLICSPVLKAKTRILCIYIYILICTYIYHKLDPSLKSNDFTELTYGTIDSSKSKQHQLQGVPGVDLPANMATQRSPISLIWLCATSNMCMIYIYMYIYWIYCTSYRHGIYSQIWVDSPSY